MRSTVIFPVTFAIAMSVASLASQAHAQSRDPASAPQGVEADRAAQPDGDYVVLGAGALFYHSPFKGEGTSILPIPVVSVRQGPFYIEGLEAGATLAPFADGALRPSLSAFVSARAIAGENREKITADAGVRAALDTPAGTISLAYLRDVTGTFNGGEFVARYSIDIPAGPVQITPALQASWMDAKTANHLYGVTAKQQARLIAKNVAVVPPIYTVTEKALNLGGDITLTAPVGDHFLLIGYLGGTYLGKSIRRNPGLRDEWEAQALLGVAYRF